MLPGIAVGVRYLSTPGQNVLSEINYDYFSMNYKVTISLSQPLFLRKERGKYQLSNIKLKQAEYDLKTTNREINNLVNASYNDVITYRTMMEVQKNVYRQTQRLFEGEKQKFDIGESSLFLMNSRETKMIESKIKVFELNAKYEKAIAQMYWSAGKLSD
jgi:outer membrane protein TolC